MVGSIHRSSIRSIQCSRILCDLCICRERNQRHFEQVARIRRSVFIPRAVLAQQTMCKQADCVLCDVQSIRIILPIIPLTGILLAVIPESVRRPVVAVSLSCQRYILSVNKPVQSGISRICRSISCGACIAVHTSGNVQNYDDIGLRRILFRITGYRQCQGVRSVMIVDQRFAVCRFITDRSLHSPGNTGGVN